MNEGTAALNHINYIIVSSLLESMVTKRQIVWLDWLGISLLPSAELFNDFSDRVDGLVRRHSLFRSLKIPSHMAPSPIEIMLQIPPPS